MNAIFSGIFNALWPGLLAAVKSLTEHAEQHVAAGNHPAAAATVQAIGSLTNAAIDTVGPSIPALLGVQAPPPPPPAQ